MPSSTKFTDLDLIRMAQKDLFRQSGDPVGGAPSAMNWNINAGNSTGSSLGLRRQRSQVRSLSGARVPFLTDGKAARGQVEYIVIP